MLFNFIPGSGLVAPGTFAEVNSGGQYTSNSRALVVGLKSAAGSLATDTPVICSTIEEAATYAGVGSMLYETVRQVRRHAPVQEVWIAAIPVTGVAGIWTITFASIPAAGGDWTLEIAGRTIRGSALAGDTATNVATAVAAAINAYVDKSNMAYLPVTATSAAAVVTVTARHAGALLEELEIYADAQIAGNIFGGAGVCTIAHPTAATGAPTISGLLGSLGDAPYDWIISPFGDTTNLDTADSVLSDATGRWAYNVQLYGHYFTVRTDNLAGHVSFGLGRNGRHSSSLARWASPTPSWEFLGAYVGVQLPWLSDDTGGNAARNQSDIVLDGVRPPRSRASWPNYATRNSLNNNGMSGWKVNNAGQVTTDKAVTHYRTNTAGQPDETFRNVQKLAVVMHALRYLRAGISYRYGNKALAASNPANVNTIVTPREINAGIVELYIDLVSRGLVQDAASFAKSLLVEIDASNANRVNVALNLRSVNPLDIFAINATIWSQARAA